MSEGSNDIRARCLVDTGSPGCIFSRAIAEALYVDMSPGGGPDRSLRILGGVHRARVSTATLELPPFEGLHWTAEVLFLHEDLAISFAGVLGQRGFLDRWVASFNLYDGYFVIEERDAFVQRLGVDPVAEAERIGPVDWDRPTVE
jgi:hypothetical protein